MNIQQSMSLPRKTSGWNHNSTLRPRGGLEQQQGSRRRRTWAERPRTLNVGLLSGRWVWIRERKSLNYFAHKTEKPRQGILGNEQKQTNIKRTAIRHYYFWCTVVLLASHKMFLFYEEQPATCNYTNSHICSWEHRQANRLTASGETINHSGGPVDEFPLI